MVGRSALLLALSAAAAPLVSRQSSPCSALSSSSSTYYRPSDVLKCMQSVPFDTGVKDNIMGVVTALYTLDIFQYNQLADNDAVLNQGVDVIKEFARINGTTYTSDFDFQNDLSQVMNSLNDGHHAWTSCYNTLWQASHAVPIISVQAATGDDPLLYIVPDVDVFVRGYRFASMYSQLGFNASGLAGAQVLGIEGVPAWDYLHNVLVPSVGVYQDPAQRLNSLFASYTGALGAIGRTPGAFTSTSNFTSDSIRVTVKTSDGQTGDVEIPWLASWGGNSQFNYDSGSGFFENECLLSVSESSVPTTTATATVPEVTGTGSTNGTETPEEVPSAGSLPPLSELAPQIYAACPLIPSAARYPLANPPTNSSSYLGGRDIQFFTLPDQPGVGTIFLPTFEPIPGRYAAADACNVRFIIDAIIGLQNLTAAGVSKVLIDTSNNGGGSVLLSQVLQRLMTGEKYEPENNFQSLLRKSPLAEAFVEAHIANPSALTGSFGPQLFRNGSSDLSAGTDYFEPGLSFTINGQTLLTSNYLEDSIDALNAIQSAWNLSDMAPFAPNQIVFTGNGLCGSACSSFTNFLIEYYNATAFISTPYPDKPIEFQAFAAGQASSSDQIYTEAAQIGLSTPLLPELGVVGSFGFALRGALSPNIKPGDFLQYRPFPAQYRYQMVQSDYTNPASAWSYVASQVFK